MNVKIVWVVSTLVLLVACGGNTQRKRAAQNSRPATATSTPGECMLIIYPDESEMKQEDVRSRKKVEREILAEIDAVDENVKLLDDDYVLVSHKWKDIDVSAFVGRRPTPEEITKWKTEFEKANGRDTVWLQEVLYCGNVNRYLAVYDLIELFYGQYNDDSKDDDRRTQWRILQFGAGDMTRPETEFEKLFRLKRLCDELLDYEYRTSQWAMNVGAWLGVDIDNFYIRLLYDVNAKHLDDDLASALRTEQAAAWKSMASMSEAYQTIDGSPSGFNGSSYPYRVGSFVRLASEMELIGQEMLMRSLLGGPQVSSAAFVSAQRAKTLIQAEYGKFESTFVDGEMFEEGEVYSAEEKRAAVEADRRDWNAWMHRREELSALLSESVRQDYDKATVRICRHKLIMLKNRYESGVYITEDKKKVLLPYEESTAEEILSHDFEKMLREL